MHFLKWRSKKKAKTQNGHRSHSPINPISIVGALTLPPTSTLTATTAPSVIDDDSDSGPYAPSQSTTIAARSQITTISKQNGDAKHKSKRKTSRVSFQLGPAVLPNDLPNKCLSECGTVSSARFPKPSLKSNAIQQQSIKQPPIIEHFDFDAYVSYVTNVKKCLGRG